MPPTVTFRGNRDDLHRLVARTVAALTGRGPDPLGLARGLQLRLSTVALSKIQQEYVALSNRGVAPSDGRKWAELAPSTIRKKQAKERKATRGKRGKGKPFAGHYPIGRDTGRLLRSLTPGVDDRPSGAPDQVIEHRAGSVVVGTNVPHAKSFHAGREHQPARPITPATLPAAWGTALLDAGLRGAVRALELAFAGGGRG